jgi:hypothetical protein
MVQLEDHRFVESWPIARGACCVAAAVQHPCANKQLYAVLDDGVQLCTWKRSDGRMVDGTTARFAGQRRRVASVHVSPSLLTGLVVVVHANADVSVLSPDLATSHAQWSVKQRPTVAATAPFARPSPDHQMVRVVAASLSNIAASSRRRHLERERRCALALFWQATEAANGVAHYHCAELSIDTKSVDAVWTVLLAPPSEASELVRHCSAAAVTMCYKQTQKCRFALPSLSVLLVHESSHCAAHVCRWVQRICVRCPG